MTDYEALVAFGHTPEKAKEIALDASRGNAYANKWIAMCLKKVTAEKIGRGAAK